MHRLSQRVRELEKRSGLDGSFVSFPLPGRPEEFVRLPRSFADWLAEKGQESRSDGRYFNLTDGRWEEC